MGKFIASKESRENYAIRIIAKCQHITHKLSEDKIVSRIGNHYEKNIKVVILSRVINTTEKLLILLAQQDDWESGCKNMERCETHGH